MPELPEVETTRRGLERYLINQTITKIIVREHRLRWPVPNELMQAEQQNVTALTRRGKYLILHTNIGAAIIHLGMSGCLRVSAEVTPPQKHDHIDISFSNNMFLRFSDPRRFGCCLWTADNPLLHHLLIHLGPEPLMDNFNANYLYQRTRNTKRAIKEVIMDSHIVVGVGNIYAAESLFRAGIHPLQAANTISSARYKKLITAIKDILSHAIERGGTTLRDFLNSDGKPGYFKQELQVYGRAGELCRICGKKLLLIRQQNRATVYCPLCQK
jgi:formamidopyrimidine-DNA glycosylase